MCVIMLGGEKTHTRENKKFKFIYFYVSFLLSWFYSSDDEQIVRKASIQSKEYIDFHLHKFLFEIKK